MTFYRRNGGVIEKIGNIFSIELLSSVKYFKTALNKKGDKALICIIFINGLNTCFYYYFNSNEFSSYYNCNNNICKNKYYGLNVNYFPENDEYVFSCTGNNGNITLCIFNNQSEYYSTMIKFDECESIDSYSIINLGEYYIFSEERCSGLINSTQKIVSTSIIEETEEQTKELDRPSEEIKTDVHTEEEQTETQEEIIDFKCELKKCKTCDMKSQEKNLCIKCDVENGYFPLNISFLSLFEYKDNYIDCCPFGTQINENEYDFSNKMCQLLNKLPYIYSNSGELVNFCPVNDLINNKCKINNIFDNFLEEITENVENIIKNDILNENENILISSNNIVYQIKTSKIKNKYNNISNIYFGECETTLKQENNIDYFIILKIDIKINDIMPAKVEYEVFDPNTKEKLDLSVCHNKINIEVPLTLDNNSLELFQKFYDNGIDILNKHDPFYNDIFKIFTTDDNTDIILSDRRTEYYKGNELLCEKGCIYNSYDLKSQLVNCDCSIKLNIINKISNDINLVKEDLSSFFNIKTYANIACIKCYKLLFSKQGFTNNYGNYISLLILLSFIIIMILFYKKYDNKILDLISKALESKNNLPNPQKKKIIKKIKKTKKNKINNSIQLGESNIMINQETKKIKNNNELETDYKNSKIKNNNLKLNLNDEEINSLDYTKALIFDKRSFIQYYISLIKKKHLILFSFYPNNDYNLMIMKIGLFLISFSLYFTVNALFFDDITMHKIYRDKGNYNFIFQLPKIIYSSIITSTINLIVKSLSLSEPNIISLKKHYKTDIFITEKQEIIRTLKIKFNIFLIVVFLLLCLFWYYCSVFCSVYKNTQIILIKNTFSSFAISLIFPLLINFLPGLFRIPSLRNKNKGLYIISKLIAVI